MRILRRIKYSIIVQLSILIVLALLILAFWQFSVKVYLQSPLREGHEPVYYHFKPKSSFRKLVSDLVKKGLVDKPDYLLAYAVLRGKDRRLMSGLYKIEPDQQTPMDMLEMFHKGDVASFKARIAEGLTFKKILESIKKNDKLIHTIKDYEPEKVMAAINVNSDIYEGYFFPDTYKIPYGTTDVNFLRQAYRTMSKILDSEWQQRDEDIVIKSKAEALILASIIEKETSRTDERSKVSAVFHNRLKRKMRLQTDPTVIYGMGDKFKGDIRRKDFRDPSPYNTYVIKGLPPTPICMPGRASIRAALHPADIEDIFFVATGDDGKHYFSKSYKEHKKAVYKYQILPYKKSKNRSK